MYPSSNQNPQQNPGDYLNQIATTSPSKMDVLRNNPILMLGVVAGLLLVIVLLGGLIFSGKSKSTEQLAAQLTITESTVEDASSKIKGSSLRALNSNLKLFLTNTIRDITPILEKDNVKIKNLSKTLLAKESDAELLSRLEDARLNAIYDRTYAREMAYKIETLMTLMQQINVKTTNKDLKTILTDAKNSLEPIQKEFADFNQTTS